MKARDLNSQAQEAGIFSEISFNWKGGVLLIIPTRIIEMGFLRMFSLPSRKRGYTLLYSIKKCSALRTGNG
ncbi:hypothetical protein DA456_25685 [Pseudomonas syringae pv. atrofaciens]|jgi:hypothetical protein|uniref:Uncharacterized protein n=2 Tax=Pseudomonas syringae TaxID=317 RepID=A0AAE5VT36_PSESY|nr:hypothetical protein DA456_25685 [Pseudomonas syringae pv. atrofaciens]AZG87997.1 hypothetical protein N032_21295 [Pseudomonas syringae pv. pisi str. PP1]POQ02075.1 hypothetical protein CXB42_19750 [Pseudomonas syringae pv. syringae]UZA81334.1 hypothetical protein EZZ79_21140 [Pseudomonas syringae]